MSPDIFQTAVEFAVAVVLTLGAIMADRIRRHVKATRDQVQNTHSTNLRDDIDKVLAAVHLVTDRVDSVHTEQLAQRSDIQQIRVELTQERTERLAADERLRFAS